MNKYKQPTITLVMNFHKREGVKKPFVQFEYVPQTIFPHTGGQAFG